MTNNERIKTMDNNFAVDVLEGLSSKPKFLPCKYFYDENGDRIFQAIMELDEYYLTRCEYEILQDNKEKLLDILISKSGRFNVLELGAGDGLKTKVLLEHFLERGAEFTYMPIDISSNAVELLENDLKEQYPGLKFRGIVSDYFEFLEKYNHEEHDSTIILFLGSNIGNFTMEEAIEFLGRISQNMSRDDLLLIGFDLKKDPSVILDAYNDNSGVTAAFNMNLLNRINRELGADFDIAGFEHYPVYDPVTGECKSFIISIAEQSVRIEALERSFHFGKWETVFTEVSQKYDMNFIELLAKEAGFRIVDNLYDRKNYFVDSLWKLK